MDRAEWENKRNKNEILLSRGLRRKICIFLVHVIRNDRTTFLNYLYKKTEPSCFLLIAWEITRNKKKYILSMIQHPMFIRSFFFFLLFIDCKVHFNNWIWNKGAVFSIKETSVTITFPLTFCLCGCGHSLPSVYPWSDCIKSATKICRLGSRKIDWWEEMGGREREKGRKKFILTRSSILISTIKMALKH